MRVTQVHPVIAWFLLALLGLVTACPMGGVVLCHDGHGGVSLEWGCERTAGGACVETCGDRSWAGAEHEHPCEDVPIGGEAQDSKLPVRQAWGWVPPTAAVSLVVWESIGPAAQGREGVSAPPRPPDRLRHIRSVVRQV